MQHLGTFVAGPTGVSGSLPVLLYLARTSVYATHRHITFEWFDI